MDETTQTQYASLEHFDQHPFDIQSTCCVVQFAVGVIADVLPYGHCLKEFAAILFGFHRHQQTARVGLHVLIQETLTPCTLIFATKLRFGAVDAAQPMYQERALGVWFEFITIRIAL